jgi:hypothetical protein
LSYDPYAGQGSMADYYANIGGNPAQMGSFGGGGMGGAFGSGINPIQLGMGALGAVGGLYQGITQGGVQKKMMDEQLRMSRLQRNEFQQNLPLYNQALQQYGQNLGLVPGGPGGTGGNTSTEVGVGGGSYGHASGVAPGGTATYQNQYAPNSSNGFLMGPYAQQAYRLRSAANEQNLGTQTQNQDQNLLYQSKMQGLASGSAEAGIARSHEQALQDYANSQRQLAINAGPQEQAGLQSFLGMLSPGLNMAGPASATLGQQAGVYGQQAQAGYGALGSSLSNLAQSSQMSQYMQQMAQNPSLSMMGGYGGLGMGANPYGQGGSMVYNGGSGGYGL